MYKKLELDDAGFDDGRVIVPKEVMGSEMIVLIGDNKILAVLDTSENLIDGLLCDTTWKKLREFVEGRNY